MKRTPLRRISTKKRREKADTDEARHKLVHELGVCAACGFGRDLECHEILAGSYRHRSVYHRECQLVLCRSCHRFLQGRKLAEQLVYKLTSDPFWFDLDVIRSVKNTGGLLVTMSDIRAAAAAMGVI